MNSSISPKADIHPNAWINPQNVTIEEGVMIGPFCTIGLTGITVEKELFVIGDNVLQKCQGTVLIKKDAKITGHTMVGLGFKKDGCTYIGKSVIIGPQCVISHDSYIGDNSILVSRIGVSGYVKIGKGCWIGPGVTISNRVEIGDGASVSLGSVVTQNVEKGKRVTGNFAIDHDKFIGNLKKMR